MKKVIFVLLAALFLFGCSSARFENHGAIWKNYEHFKFSMWGYQDVSAQEAQMSAEQGWWGEEVPYIPAQ